MSVAPPARPASPTTGRSSAQRAQNPAQRRLVNRCIDTQPNSAVDHRRRRPGLVRTVTGDIYEPANLRLNVLTSHADALTKRRPSPDAYGIAAVDVNSHDRLRARYYA